MPKQLISIIVPVYNEANNLEWHHQKIVQFLTKQTINYELLYIDDGSTDNSLGILDQITRSDPHSRYISFSRNFGKEAATTAGLRECKGDAALMIDADGQHPIEELPEFLEQWKLGYKVVVGVRTQNTNEGIIKRYGSMFFYKILNAFTEGNTVPGSTDFRLIDRQVINEFIKLTEHGRITRGLVDWLGFKRSYVYFTSPARHSGTASYSVNKLIKLALHAFVSQTTKPLQLTGILGGTVTFASALIGIFLAFETYVFKDPLHLAVTGSAILALFVSFLVGVVLICQWLLALYIESIHNETQNRPLYIVAESSDERKD